MPLLHCPKCSTVHDVPASFFVDGDRPVRCASCREVWVAGLDVDVVSFAPINATLVERDPMGVIAEDAGAVLDDAARIVVEKDAPEPPADDFADALETIEDRAVEADIGPQKAVDFEAEITRDADPAAWGLDESALDTQGATPILSNGDAAADRNDGADFDEEAAMAELATFENESSRSSADRAGEGDQTMNAESTATDMPTAEAVDASATEALHAALAAAPLEGNVPENAPSDEPEAPAPARPAARRKRPAAGRNGSRAKPAGSPVGVLVASASLATIAALALFRTEAVRMVPQAAPIFSAIGLPVPAGAVQLANLQGDIRPEGGSEVLEISAEVVNPGKTKLPMPHLLIVLRDKAGENVYQWSTPGDEREIEPGQSVPVRRKLAAPPSNAYDVLVRFTDKDGGLAAR